MADGKWHDTDSMLDPVGMLAATRYEVEVGVKATRDGMFPAVRVKVIGHPHFPDGAINTAVLAEQSFIMQAGDVRLFGERLIEASEPQP